MSPLTLTLPLFLFKDSWKKGPSRQSRIISPFQHHFVVQSLKLCPTLCDPMDYSTPGFLVLHCLPQFSQTHVHLVDDAIQPSHPLSPICPSALNLSQDQGLFQWVRWPNYWSFIFSISSSNEYSELIFGMDWFDLLAVQGTLKSLLQYHSSKASILWCSALFMVQLSHLYMTAGKTIALTIYLC